MSDLRKFYSSVGGDFATALNRAADDEEFLISLLKTFESDKTWGDLNAAITAGDGKTAFGCAHSLKGSSGMLELNRFYKHIYDMTEVLRAGDIDAAKQLLPRCTEEYCIIIQEIRRL